MWPYVMWLVTTNLHIDCTMSQRFDCHIWTVTSPIIASCPCSPSGFQGSKYVNELCSNCTELRHKFHDLNAALIPEISSRTSRRWRLGICEPPISLFQLKCSWMNFATTVLIVPYLFLFVLPALPVGRCVTLAFPSRGSFRVPKLLLAQLLRPYFYLRCLSCPEGWCRRTLKIAKEDAENRGRPAEDRWPCKTRGWPWGKPREAHGNESSHI